MRQLQKRRQFSNNPIWLSVGLWHGDAGVHAGSRARLKEHSWKIALAVCDGVLQSSIAVAKPIKYRRHPKPRSAGIVRTLTERGDERELFAGGR